MSVLISALHQTSPERVTVALDDGSEIKATLGVVADLRLYTGRRLTEAELQTLRASAALALCKNRGLELLSYRPMSAKELRDKLTEKGEEPAAAEAAVAWLCEHSFLDDARYAGMVVRHYAGKTELTESDDKLDRFIASRLKDPSDRAQVQKVSAALYRRGFSWEEIRTALARFRADAGE